MERDFDYDFDSYEELDEYVDYECVTDDCFEYEWTEEDTWYALTDGMYGEMPDDPLMYDTFMDALDF